MWRRMTVLSGLILAGCTAQPVSDDAGDEAAMGRAATTVEPPQPPAPPQPSAAGGHAVAISNDEFEFGYSYPSEAATIPALKARLDAERATALAEIKRESAAAHAEAKASGYDPHGYGYEKAWQRVANLPDWLSLSASIWTYTGGAHGMSVFDALLWDRKAGEAVDPTEAFASKAAIDGAIRARFCRALDAQRLEKRGAVLKDDGTSFTRCIDPSPYPILFGSSNGKTFDRITVMVPPYEAGPYAEGVYEIDLPVTPALIAALKPRFRPAFSAK